MDEQDRLLLAELQNGFPVCERPFKRLAEILGTEESVVLERTKYLQENNYIRRISALASSKKIGMATTLAAASVEPNYIENVAEFISGFKEVTHNYEREGMPNIWFALVAPNRERILEILNKIKLQPGVDWVEQYPASKLFKLNVNVGGA